MKVPGARVEVWFQDEARIGQKNSLTRVWGQTGSRQDRLRSVRGQVTRVRKTVGSASASRSASAALRSGVPKPSVNRS